MNKLTLVRDDEGSEIFEIRNEENIILGIFHYHRIFDSKQTAENQDLRYLFIDKALKEIRAYFMERKQPPRRVVLSVNNYKPRSLCQIHLESIE